MLIKIANKFFIVFFVFVLFSLNLNAQYYKKNTEIGLTAGVSYYLGDLNKQHFFQSKPGAGIIIRRNIDNRFSYKASALFLSLYSDERESSDTIAQSRMLHFKSNIYELSGQLEFNFLPYESGNPLYTWTPFVYTGISLFHFNPKAENKNGEWVELQPLGTEGQETTTFPDRKRYSLMQFSIPMGGGVKIAVNESFNIILEYGIRKTFTDYLDDVSTTYPGPNINNSQWPVEMTNQAQELSDPTNNPQINYAGRERGNPDKKDWYSFTGITLSFKLKNNTAGCDY